MWRIGVSLLLLVTVASGQTIVGDGPASGVNDGGPTHIGGGPATAVIGAAVPTTTLPPTTTLAPTTTVAPTTTTTTTLILPTAGPADANCPGVIPAHGTSTTSVDYLSATITCATPAYPTTVASISFYAVVGTAGAKQKCSVYTLPAGYTAGTTAIPKVAPGCDTVEWTAPSGTVNAFVTLATTGPCPLAASTRYQIACNQGTTFSIGYNTSACTIGGVQCWQSRSPQTYATAALPDPWTANGQGTNWFAYYLTVY